MKISRIRFLVLVLLLCSGVGCAESFFSSASLFSQPTSSAPQTSGEFIYKVLEDGTAQIIQYTGTDKKVVFPDSIDGTPVTAVGEIGDLWYFFSRVVPYDTQEVVLPDGITHIGDMAFNSCIELKKINIPKSIEYIGQSAFLQCWECTIDTDFPSTLHTISDGAFWQCKKINEVIIPDGILEIGDGAFFGCGRLSVSLPHDACMSTGNPFYGNDSLSIRLRKTSSEDALELVDGCLYDNRVNQIICALPSVSSVKIRTGTKSIADNAFCDHGNLHTVIIPEGVESIGMYAFKECGITDIVLPSSVTSIGYSAFEDTRSLKEATINGHEIEMEERIFDVSGLEKITIMTSEIPIEMFRGCKKLTSVILSDEVTAIRREAFKWCDQLQSIEIPSSVQLIEDYAFDNCDNLQLIVEQDSYAYEYAVHNNISYQLKGEEPRFEVTSQEATANTTVTKTVNTKSSPLTLRKTPGNGGAKILSIPKGETVTVLEDGDWPLVEYKGRQGYVNGAYLK